MLSAIRSCPVWPGGGHVSLQELDRLVPPVVPIVIAGSAVAAPKIRDGLSLADGI